MTPTWQPIWLACRKCRHAWDDWQPCHVPVDTWIAHMRTYHCPNCSAGSDQITTRSTPLDAEPDRGFA